MTDYSREVARHRDEPPVVLVRPNLALTGVAGVLLLSVLVPPFGFVQEWLRDGHEFFRREFGPAVPGFDAAQWTVAGLALVFLLLGGWHRRFTFDAAAGVVRRERLFYWLPCGRRTWTFDDIRLVRFSYRVTRRRRRLGETEEGIHELHMVTQDRSYIHIDSSGNRERLADMASRIARLTNTRLG